MALVIAVFIAMISLFFLTVLTAAARHGAGWSNDSERETKRYYTARGEVAELHARVLSGEDLSMYTEDDPLVLDGLYEQMTAWTFYDGNIIHLHSLVDGVHSTRVIVLAGGGDAITFSNDLDQLKYNRPGDSTWTDLPTPLQQGHDSDGNLIPFTTAGMSVNYSANHQGELVASFAYTPTGSAQLYDSETETWSLLPPRPTVTYSGDTLVTGSTFNVPRGLFLTEDSIYTFENIGSGPPTGTVYGKSILQIFDRTTETWSSVKGPDNGYQNFTSKPGAIDSNGDLYATVFEDGDNGQQLIVKYTGGTWEEIPLPPGTSQAVEVEALGHGDELFVKRGDTLYKRDSDGWAAVDIPTNDEGDSVGHLDSVDADGSLLFQDGESIYRVKEDEEPEELPEIENFQRAEGGGMPTSDEGGGDSSDYSILIQL